MDRVLDVRRPPEQSLTGLSRVSKIFFGCDIFQVVAVVVFQGSMIALGDFSAYNNTEHPGMGPGRRIYMAIYMGAVVYTCFLCLFAVKKQNFMEILAFDLQNFAFFTYSCIQLYHVGFKKYKGLRTSENKILPKIVMANAATLLLLNVVFTYLSYKLYMEFGWKIYKRVRFNIRLRAIYQFYELLSCLLKMEILYWGMFALCHSLVLLRDSHSFLYKLNMAFIPMSFVYAGLGYFATRRENRLLMILFLSWTIGGIGYFLYKLYGFITRTCNGCSEFELTGKDIPEEAFMHFVYLGTINLVVAFTIFVVALKAFRNFGGGLAQHFNHKLPPTKMPAAHNLNLGRMSLYPEESVMSVTSYDSMFDEQLGESVRLDRGMMMQASVPVVTAPLLANKGLQHLQPEKRFSSLPDLRVESPPRPTSFPGPSEGDLNILSGWLRVHDNKLEQNSTVKFEIISEETLSRDGLQRDIPNDSTDKGNVMQEEIPSHCKAKTQHSDSSKSPVSRSLSSKMSNTCAGVRCNSYLNGSYEKCCGESPLTQNGENSPLLRKALLMNAKSKQEETCNDCKGKGNRGVHSVDTCECGQNVSAQCGLVQDASGSNGKLSLHTSHFFQEDKTMRDFATGHLEACDRQSVV